MQPFALVLLGIWLLLIVGGFWGVFYVRAKHDAKLRARAYDEILKERGVTRRPEETTKQALLRARREESELPLRTLQAQREAQRLNRQLRTQPYEPGPMRPKLPSRHDR